MNTSNLTTHLLEDEHHLMGARADKGLVNNVLRALSPIQMKVEMDQLTLAILVRYKMSLDVSLLQEDKTLKFDYIFTQRTALSIEKRVTVR